MNKTYSIFLKRGEHLEHYSNTKLPDIPIMPQNTRLCGKGNICVHNTCMKKFQFKMQSNNKNMLGTNP